MFDEAPDPADMPRKRLGIRTDYAERLGAVVREWANPLHPFGHVGGNQLVYTAEGPIAAAVLAQRDEFVTLVYDRSLGRIAARKAWVVEAGEGPLVRCRTSAGEFVLSPEAEIASEVGGHRGARIAVDALTPGHRLFSASMHRIAIGYVYFSLRDLEGGTALLHRLIALDVMGCDIEGKVVHHENEDPLDSRPHHLRVLENQAEHASRHARKLVEEGRHPFQVVGSTGKRRYELEADGRHEEESHGDGSRGDAVTTDGLQGDAHERHPRRRNPKMERAEDRAPIKGGASTDSSGSPDGPRARERTVRVQSIGAEVTVGMRYAIMTSEPGGDVLSPSPVVVWPSGNAGPYGKGILVYGV